MANITLIRRINNNRKWGRGICLLLISEILILDIAQYIPNQLLLKIIHTYYSIVLHIITGLI